MNSFSLLLMNVLRVRGKSTVKETYEKSGGETEREGEREREKVGGMNYATRQHYAVRKFNGATSFIYFMCCV